MGEAPRIAVVLVQHGGRYLVGKRGAGALAGYWEFPGGKCRADETLEVCAARECREETGLEVRVAGLCARVEHAYAHGKVVLHFFDAEPVDASARPLGTYRWVPAEELGRYRFPEANARVLAGMTGRAGRQGATGGWAPHSCR